MDISQLITDLLEISQKNSISHYKRDRCADAATALSTLQAESEKLRAELEQVKKCIEIVEFQRDAAIKDLSEIIGDIEKIRCEYDVNNSDADDAYMNLCGIYCANESCICYKEDENYRCKNFKWRGPHKED